MMGDQGIVRTSGLRFEISHIDSHSLHYVSEHWEKIFQNSRGERRFKVLYIDQGTAQTIGSGKLKLCTKALINVGIH